MTLRFTLGNMGFFTFYETKKCNSLKEELKNSNH